MILDFYDTHKFKIEATFNTPFDKEKIMSISHNNLKAVNDKINMRLVKTRINEYDSILNELHQKLGGKGKMEISVKNKILNDIVNSNEPLGKKDSI